MLDKKHLTFLKKYDIIIIVKNKGVHTMKKLFEFIESELYIFYLCCIADKKKKRGKN